MVRRNNGRKIRQQTLYLQHHLGSYWFAPYNVNPSNRTGGQVRSNPREEKSSQGGFAYQRAA